MAGVSSNTDPKALIKERFHAIQSLSDLAALMNYIEKNELDGGANLSIIELDTLYRVVSQKASYYTRFSIPKKNGEFREIWAPQGSLLRILKPLNRILQCIVEGNIHRCTNGFLYGRDIVRNARPHVNKRFVLNCDILNFFPSVEERRIEAVLGLNPINLKENKKNIAAYIADVCVLNGYLVQGAPTSPVLSNLVTQKLDRKLSAYCLAKKVKYTRYADDLTFSCNRQLFDERFISDIREIVRSENFKLNESKTRVRSDMDRQEVTGLVVNQKVNIPREYLKKVRAMLNNWDKKGLSYAKRKFRIHQPPQKREYDFINVLSGHVAFIGNVRGKEDSIFRKFHIKLNTLKNRIDYSYIKNISVRDRLEKDNRKMEAILLDEVHKSEDKFIAFCTEGFHQIENLLNYYYHLRFPNFNDLLQYLIDFNPGFSKHKPAENAASKFKDIGKLQISNLIYIFEKEFYINNNDGEYYDKRVTFLREIRNDESHRCSIYELDPHSVRSKYAQLQNLKQEFKQRNKIYPPQSAEENKIELNYNVLKFVEQKDFYFSRKIVKEVSKIIEKELKKIKETNHESTISESIEITSSQE